MRRPHLVLRVLMAAAAAAAALHCATAQTLPDCTPDDIGHTYLTCDQSTQTRVGTYFYTTPCNPTPDTQLPPPIPNLPCKIMCDPGYYLPFGASACQACDPGFYSIGGASVYTDWTSMPPEFRTDCTGTNCNVWTAENTYVLSGNVTGINNVDLNLYLVTMITRNTGSFIQFTFRVDAENCGSSLICDGLRFYIDNVLVMPLVSSSIAWQTVRFNVSAGQHEFRWNYHKDYSVSFGEDMAALQSIEVFGTQPFVEECAVCPTGTFSKNPGSTSCTKCGYNTFSSATNSSSCLSCSSSQYAFAGSSSCTNSPACTLRDYYVVNTPCSGGTYNQVAKVKEYVPGVIKTCNPSSPNSVSPPIVPVNIPCTCPKGLILDQGICKACSPGQSSIDGFCKTCPAGTSAPNIIEITDWSSVPSIFTSFCEGDCDRAGWLPRGSSIHSGYNFYLQMDSYLRTTQTFTNDQGSVKFNLKLTVSGQYYYRRDVFLQFTMDNNTDGTLYSSMIKLPIGSSNNLGYFNRTFPVTNAGTYNITWRFHVGDGGGFDRDTYAELSSVRFTGIVAGGAYRCEPCPAGQGSSAGAISCDDCKPGFYSSASGQACLPVPDGNFTNTYRATSYIPCGPGTTSNADHTDCVTNECHYTTTGTIVHEGHAADLVYDLSPLTNPDLMYFAGVDASHNSYFVNMCQRGSSNVTCFTSSGDLISSFACQTVQGWGYSVDIGNVIGFSALQPLADANKGLVVTFDNGTPGCVNYYNNTARPRRTNITMVCDLNAGIGTPVPMYNTTVEYPPRSCIYNFIWKSAHACPLCTLADYTFEAQPCINGYKVYMYKKAYNCFGEPTPDQYPAPIKCYACPTGNIGVECDGRGSCDDLRGVCNCQSQFAGSSCSDCNTGYFGVTCQNACPGGARNPCNSHGVCDSGVKGTGMCVCSTGWMGSACDQCDAGFSGTNCDPIPAGLTDVLPAWAVAVIIIGVIGLIVAAIFLYRAKRKMEYKYSRLLTSQPIELADDDTPVQNTLSALPDDEERNNELDSGDK